MTERFEQLQKSASPVYKSGAPVIIAASALLKDTQTGGIIAQIKFQSIDNRTIAAVFADFRAKDISGAVLDGVADFQYLDLNAKRNEHFGAKTAVNMPDNKTRNFAINIKRVIFADKTEWTPPADTAWTSIALHTLTDALESKGLAEQYKRDTIMSAEYAPQVIADLWLCACGNFNRDTEENCFRCRLEKQKAFTAMDKDTLQANLAAYNEGLRRRAEQEKAKEEEEAEKRLDEETQRTIKTAAIFLIVILCVVIGWRVFNTFFS
jgi:hypothetical protein